MTYPEDYLRGKMKSASWSSTELSPELCSFGQLLVFEFFEKLDHLLGEARVSPTLLRIAVAEFGPCVEISESESSVIFVGPNAVLYRPTFVANIAHESVHLHESTTGWASGLEEGFATNFELQEIESRFGVEEQSRFRSSLPESYATSLQDFRCFVRSYPDGVRDVRRRFGALSKIKALSFWATYPRVGMRRAIRLSMRKQMR